MWRTFGLLAMAGLVIGGLYFAVWYRGDSTPQAKPDEPETHAKKQHEHDKGIVALDNYHAKLVVEEGGILRLFILDKDEKKAAQIERQEIPISVRAEGDPASVRVTLTPDPEENGEKVSAFTGALPEELQNKPLRVTARLKINGVPYVPEFASLGHGDRRHAAMPAVPTAGSKKERDLFLTAGGIYTEGDIQANGKTVPREKFKGIDWPHDDITQVGEKICPVTDNKADPRCTWVVGGEIYEFCCHPCLTKFVTWAKSEADKTRIKSPDHYVSTEDHVKKKR